MCSNTNWANPASFQDLQYPISDAPEPSPIPHPPPLPPQKYVKVLAAKEKKYDDIHVSVDETDWEVSILPTSLPKVGPINNLVCTNKCAQLSVHNWMSTIKCVQFSVHTLVWMIQCAQFSSHILLCTIKCVQFSVHN